MSEESADHLADLTVALLTILSTQMHHARRTVLVRLKMSISQQSREHDTCRNANLMFVTVIRYIRNTTETSRKARQSWIRMKSKCIQLTQMAELRRNNPSELVIGQPQAIDSQQ